MGEQSGGRHQPTAAAPLHSSSTSPAQHQAGADDNSSAGPRAQAERGAERPTRAAVAFFFGPWPFLRTSTVDRAPGAAAPPLWSQPHLRCGPQRVRPRAWARSGTPPALPPPAAASCRRCAWPRVPGAAGPLSGARRAGACFRPAALTPPRSASRRVGPRRLLGSSWRGCPPRRRAAASATVATALVRRRLPPACLRACPGGPWACCHRRRRAVLMFRTQEGGRALQRSSQRLRSRLTRPRAALPQMMPPPPSPAPSGRAATAGAR